MTVHSHLSDPAPVLAPAPSPRAAVAGKILTGLAVSFLVLDAAMKVLRAPAAVAGTTQLGFPDGVVRGIGLLQLCCLALYLVPRTSALGALLLTGYLGGAVASHVRVESPLLTHVLFPVFIALLVWGGLWLRDMRVRGLLPLLTR